MMTVLSTQALGDVVARMWADFGPSHRARFNGLPQIGGMVLVLQDGSSLGVKPIYVGVELSSTEIRSSKYDPSSLLRIVSERLVRAAAVLATLTERARPHGFLGTPLDLLGRGDGCVVRRDYMTDSAHIFAASYCFTDTVMKMPFNKAPIVSRDCSDLDALVAHGLRLLEPPTGVDAWIPEPEPGPCPTCGMGACMHPRPEVPR